MPARFDPDATRAPAERGYDRASWVIVVRSGSASPQDPGARSRRSLATIPRSSAVLTGLDEVNSVQPLHPYLEFRLPVRGDEHDEGTGLEGPNTCTSSQPFMVTPCAGGARRR
jgi:hypothetical protein